MPSSRPALPLKQVIFVLLSTAGIQIAIVYFIHRLYGVKLGAVADHPDVLSQLTIWPAIAAIAWIWFTAVWNQPGGGAIIGAVPAEGQWIRLSLIAAIVCFFVNVIFGNLMAGLMDNTPNPTIPTKVIANADTFALIGMGIGVSVIAPIFEELLFRGVLYGYLRKQFSILFAAGIAAAIHAAFHGSLAALPGLFMVFLVFAYLYEKTGSIWAPCLAHGLHNFIVFCIGYAHATKVI